MAAVVTSRTVLFLGLMLIAPACAPDPPDLSPHSDDDDDASGDDDDVSLVFPRIVVDSPQRGSFHEAGSTVEIVGRCFEGAAPLHSLTLDEAPVSLSADGAFSHELHAVDGINVVKLQLEDTDGERATEALGLHYGPTNAPGVLIPSAMVVQVAPQLLDDDDPDLDDTASLVEAILEDPSTFEDPPAVTYSYAELTLTSLQVASADVDLTPQAGFLAVATSIHDLYASFDAQGTGFWDWVEVSGEADVGLASMTMELAPSVVGGDVVVTVQSVDVTLDDLQMDVEWVPDDLEDYLSDYIADYVEDELREMAEELVATFLDELLSAAAMEFQFSEEIPVTLSIELHSLEVSPAGMTYILDGRSTAAPQFELHPLAGSLRSAGSPPTAPFSAFPLSVAVDDDFANQLMFAIWSAGGMAWTFTEEELAAMGAEDIPAPLGPAATADVDIGLPMVVTPTDLADFDYDVGIGEVRADLTRTDGEVLAFSVNILAGGLVQSSPDGSLGMVLDDRPAELTLGVSTLEYPDGQVPANLAALVHVIVPPMLAKGNEAVPGFFLPEVDLQPMADIDFFVGRSIVLDNPQVGTVDGEGLWMLLEGGVSVQ
jgi:hypothetical protein